MGEPLNLQDRILGRRGPPPDDDPDAAEDCEAFGYLRGAKDRAPMIDFRLANGGRVAFPYATLERVAFDPSDGLTLWFLGARVHLTGRNLGRPGPAGVSLVDALHRHRVPWVAEVDELRGAVKPDAAAVVTRIEVEAAR